MQRPHRTALLAALALAACARPNPLYCDEQTPCQAPDATCDITTHTCRPHPADLAIAPADAMEDLAIPDLAIVDLSDEDLSILDLTIAPDLSRCTTSSQCPDDRPICANGDCRACNAPADDAECAVHNARAPRCHAATGRCSECRAVTAELDCQSRLRPVCDETLLPTCRGCLTDDECIDGRLCLSDGSCPSAGFIRHVDADDPRCVKPPDGGVPDGGVGRPVDTVFCEISTALEDLAGATYVRVAGTQTGAVYSPFSVRGTTTVTIVGPGRGTPSKAVITGQRDCVTVLNQARVTLQGVTISGCNGHGVTCVGDGLKTAVSLQDLTIREATLNGIYASSCEITTNRVWVVGADTVGIELRGGTYFIQNTTIADSDLFGVALLSGARGWFQFNTIVFNKSRPLTVPFGDGNAGIHCDTDGLPPRTIGASIIIGNTMGAASQITGNCNLVKSVIGPNDFFPTGTRLRPRFVSDPLYPPDAGAQPPDYHLLPGDPANIGCCIDQVLPVNDPSIPDVPPTDIDGHPRPTGPAVDVGADETQ